MLNTKKLYTKYAPIIILRDSLQDAQGTKNYILSMNEPKEVKLEIEKIDLYIEQCHEAIIHLQENRNKLNRELNGSNRKD